MGGDAVAQQAVSGDIIGQVFLFLVIGAVILVPIILKNRLQQKQLETIATAIERGIEPERIRASLPVSEKSADANGNWKASLILIGLGVVYLLLFALPLVVAEGAPAGKSIPAFLPGVILVVLGGILMHIHKTVVGSVVKLNSAADGSGHDIKAVKDDALDS